MPKPAPATKAKTIPVNEGPMRLDAHPTAPAGMKRQDIRVELAEKHGINMATTRDTSLAALVETLVQSRLSREDEVRRGRATAVKVAAPEPEQVEAFSIQVKPSKPADPDTCKHGEDPVLCEACEDEMFADDEDDDDDEQAEAEQRWDAETHAVDDDAEWVAEQRAVKGHETGPVINLDDVYEPDAEQVFEEHDPAPEVAAAIENAAVVPTTEESMEDEDDWFDSVVTEQDNAAAALPPALFIGMPGVHDYSFSGHAGTGPSGADRWMNCTASLEMSRKFLANLSNNQQAEFADANAAARQGTTAHAAAEVEARVILGEMDANEAEHELFELAINPPAGEDYTPEMAEFITEYTDLIGGYVKDGHRVLIEERVLAAVPLTAPLPLETATDEDGKAVDYYVIPGSVDCGVMPTEEEKVLTAVDLKYGEGKDVDVEANPQIRIYMLGLLALFIEAGGDLDDLERLDYIIAQPRLGGIKAWTESVNDLLTWRDEVLSPALTAALGLAPSAFSPGESTCQWCPARGGCKALADARVAAATELFTALDDAEFGDGPALVAADLDNDRLSSLLKQITGLTDLQADLKAEAQRRMYRGETVPGMVLLNYTPPRAWREDAESFFSDEDNEALPAWREPELRTPTQFIKAMAGEFKGKNTAEREAAAQAKFARLIDVPDKRPVVGFEGDRRSKWQGKAPDQMFDIIED